MKITDQEYKAALRHYGDVVRVADAVNLPKDEDMGAQLVWVLLGIGSRESAWGTSRFLDIRGPGGRGDHGHGHGIMQIDDRWHATYIDTGAWSDPSSNIAYGASVLIDAWKYLRRKDLVDPVLFRAAIAAYNAGPWPVYSAILRGRDPDHPTTGRNYAADVIERAAWYEQRIRHDFALDDIHPVPLRPLD